MRHALCFVVSAIATAIGTVFTKKYVSAIPARGTAMTLRSPFAMPPRRRYTWPAAWTVRTRTDILNRVRYAAVRVRAFSID